MRIKIYKLIEEIVEAGAVAGYHRAHKHQSAPDDYTITNCIAEYIMNGFDEAFEFDKEED